MAKFFNRNFFCICIFISFELSICSIDDFAVRCTGCVRSVCGDNGINGFNVVCIVFANELHTCRFLIFSPLPFIQGIFVIDCRKCNFFCICVLLSFKPSICSIDNFAVRRTGCVRRVGGNYGFNGFNVVCIVFADEFHTCRFLVFSPQPRIQCVFVIDCRKCNFFCISVCLSFKFSICSIDNFAVRCTGCVRRVGGDNGFNGFNVVYIVFADKFHTCGFLIFSPRPRIQCVIVTKFFKRNFLCVSIFISFKFSFRCIDDFAVRCTGCVRCVCSNNSINGFNMVRIVLTNKLHTCRFFVICPNPRIQRIIVVMDFSFIPVQHSICCTITCQHAHCFAYACWIP